MPSSSKARVSHPWGDTCSISSSQRGDLDLVGPRHETSPAAPLAEGVKEVTWDAFLRPQVPDWNTAGMCLCRAARRECQGSACSPQRIAAEQPFSSGGAGSCRHTRTAPRPGDSPWPAVSPEPNGKALSYSGYKSERAAPDATRGVPSKHQLADHQNWKVCRDRELVRLHGAR